ncbi:MAG: hypothetical protein IBJ14_11715 [Hydrogenophaga sp.]|nr:hypothetical protein [Hydrogenophaga sp.]
MATPSKSAGTSHSSGSEANTGTRVLPTAQAVLDLRDLIETKARQLRAMTAAAYGNDHFQNLTPLVQDEYMWACADLAQSIVDALDACSEVDWVPRETVKGNQHAPTGGAL